MKASRVVHLCCILCVGTIQFGTLDTGGVNNTGGKFATGVKDAGGKLPLVSTTPVANNGNNYQTADNLK
jgi:hypothetical protein